MLRLVFIEISATVLCVTAKAETFHKDLHCAECSSVFFRGNDSLMTRHTVEVGTSLARVSGCCARAFTAGVMLDGAVTGTTVTDGVWIFWDLDDACRDFTFTGKRLKDVLASAKLLYEADPLTAALTEDQEWMSENYAGGSGGAR